MQPLGAASAEQGLRTVNLIDRCRRCSRNENGPANARPEWALISSLWNLPVAIAAVIRAPVARPPVVAAITPILDAINLRQCVHGQVNGGAIRGGCGNAGHSRQANADRSECGQYS